MGFNIEKEREEFEEYYAKNHVPSIMVGRTFDQRNGYYVRDEVQLMWLGWQAAKGHAAKQDGWIKVEDKLPPTDETVLLLDYRNNMQSGYLDGDAVAFVYTYGDSWLDDGVITHWKRLPALPEKE